MKESIIWDKNVCHCIVGTSHTCLAVYQESCVAIKVTLIFFSVLDKLHERQRDPDEKVRQEVVITICEAASENIDSVTDQVVTSSTFRSLI